MKIGFFTDSYLPSPDGVATSVESSAKELQKLGHEVSIIAPNQPHTKDREHIYRLLSIRIVKAPDVWWALEVPQPALFKIANLEFDIIHGHSGGPVSFLGWQLAQLHTIPFVETYHTLWKYYRHYLPNPDLVKLWMVKKFTAYVGNDCDAMIAPTFKAKKDLVADGVKKPVYIVPNGIYIENFSGREKGYLHKRLHISADKKILLTVGRLHKEKAIDFLITSFKEVKKTFPDTVFVIIGKGHNEAYLKKMAETLQLTDSIYFAGSIPYADMPSAYADTDLFLFASTTETQGMVVVEALASGVPVIAVKDNAFVDVIENEINGYLVDKDTGQFAKKIKTVLHDEIVLKKLSHNARKSAEQFSIDYTTRILEQVYQEIIFEKTTEIGKNPTRPLTMQEKNILSLIDVGKHISLDYNTLKDLLKSIKY